MVLSFPITGENPSQRRGTHAASGLLLGSFSVARGTVLWGFKEAGGTAARRKNAGDRSETARGRVLTPFIYLFGCLIFLSPITSPACCPANKGQAIS